MPAYSDNYWMQLALDLAKKGEGFVEPNPMVGCVIVREQTNLGSGCHERFGGPHAEVNALAIAGDNARGATVYVTLEPCSHFGKTPPCVDALIAAKVSRVVVAHPDPNPQVNGSGLAKLRAAGIEVVEGIEQAAAHQLLLPFLTLITKSRPWIIAKWAMSLDGKIATVSGESQWISNETSRAHAHATRRCVDAILVGSGTARADDPLLTARPPGPRKAVRIVVDASAKLPPNSQLAKTAGDIPTIVAVGPDADTLRVKALQDVGVEIWRSEVGDKGMMIRQLMLELGRRQMTNVLVEGGGKLLGVFLAEGLIDETHVYVASKLLGGESAPTPIEGSGIAKLADTLQLQAQPPQILDGDTLIEARRAGL
ncbi:MAG: bifunctional diaminohydroxyphosphoribosylaminopyrimidine deaminase/5-amino-6-(5-phosphoribosylamino)uracil reductase RibD [Pirellulaceae bacterium]